MKRSNLLLFLLFVLPFTLLGQVKTSIKDDVKTLTKTDANGHVVEKSKQEWNGNMWVNARRSLFTYDARGNRIKIVNQRWNGFGWMNRKKSTIAYNTKRKKIEETEEYWLGSGWGNGIKYLYTYDINGNQSERVKQRWKDNGWVNSHRNLYKYDANGRQLHSRTQNWKDNRWIDTETYKKKAAITQQKELEQAAKDAIKVTWLDIDSTDRAAFKKIENNAGLELEFNLLDLGEEYDSIENIVDSIEILPVFPGGYKMFKNYIDFNIEYPESASSKGIVGDVYTRFTVNKKGKIVNIKTSAEAREDMARACIEVLADMPNWKPGKLYEEPVDVTFGITITFKP